jgi:hypothetical protein
MGRPEHGRKDKTAGIGQPKQDYRGKTARTGLLWQANQDKPVGTGQPEKSAWTGQREQDGQT